VAVLARHGEARGPVPARQAEERLPPRPEQQPHHLEVAVLARGVEARDPVGLGLEQLRLPARPDQGLGDGEVAVEARDAQTGGAVLGTLGKQRHAMQRQEQPSMSFPRIENGQSIGGAEFPSCSR
jgi:hypothetical protein